ncbi:M48 family metallopeptidase [Glaciecola sp. KUL10]|uniref:M48 family metallopeptidase n=1 Tax=Glaciecola sp. (strain KUL10) TaxID=2161813 RepID=UPI000D78BF2A|nr:M48 family metallopeptidase [Glaciecola sp. KUL10]GBL05589.1 Zn-dependent protease with chaperone function [Glaciecola sp. KUL10]
MLSKIKHLTLGIFAFIILSACSTSPTGRSQILLFSDNQLSQMSEQTFNAMKSEIKISNKSIENNYVICIAKHITQQLPDSVFSGNWEVVVFDDPQANAFAMPGGKIGVYTGLLEVASNQHQVAAVIGHEVGHVIAQHGNERMSRSALISAGAQATSAALDAYNVENKATIMQAFGIGAQYLGILPFSREHESESDLIGLELMARAGFDPRESVQLWINMSAANEGKAPPEWASTHPSSETRIRQLNANMSSALSIYDEVSNKPTCK